LMFLGVSGVCAATPHAWYLRGLETKTPQGPKAVLQADPDLQHPAHQAIRTQIESSKKSAVNWSRIS
jgi:hypothetical protein